jgi:2,3-bisphosphoglycerate-independent phosphoglycerate mutase
MKVVVVILDGLADDHVRDGKTPVESAKAPCLHGLAAQSHPVLLKTIYHGLPVGSIVANLGLLGYDPYQYFPDGRSYFELRARYKGEIGEHDLILRCNTISVDPSDDIADFTAGQIPDALAAEIVDRISKALPSNYELYHGKNYRNVLIIRDSTLKPRDIVAFEPHSRIGSNIFDLRIIQGNRTLSPAQKKEIQFINSVMYGTISQLAEINKTSHSRADMLWFWAPSYPANMFVFGERFGFSKPWIIAGSDFLHGIGEEAGIGFAVNDRYTGESDTDFAGKGQEAVRKLREGTDFLYVHINATDEESHQKDYGKKTRIIEMVDREILQPIINYVDNAGEDIAIAVGGDHYTSSLSGNHLEDESPFVFRLPGKPCNSLSRFSERDIIAKSKATLLSTEMIGALCGSSLPSPDSKKYDWG